MADSFEQGFHALPFHYLADVSYEDTLDCKYVSAMSLIRKSCLRRDANPDRGNLSVRFPFPPIQRTRQRAERLRQVHHTAGGVRFDVAL